MFGPLPDLTPRDSHSLWYSSSRTPVYPGPSPDDHQQVPGANNDRHARRRGAQALERTSLHRLATDEFWAARRKHNVAHFGSHWLKPPGIPKTLHQLLEERREQEEHQEAMRREQLAQELAEAEAEAAAAVVDPGGGVPGGEGEMDDVQLDGAQDQDLDDDIPEAGDDYFMDDDDDDDSDSDVSSDDDDDAEEEEEGDPEDDDERAAERQNDLVAARMRMTDDAFREALARGDPDGDDMYGGDEELHEQGQGHMLDEDDFGADADGLDDAIDMDANLDDDIPEAEDEDGGYEHTDSEAELSSSSSVDEDESHVGPASSSDAGGTDQQHLPSSDADGAPSSQPGQLASSDDGQRGHEEEEDYQEEDSIGFAPRVAPLGPPQSPTLRGRAAGFGGMRAYDAGPRASLDISGILSQDESSFMDSSPVQRRARH